MRCLFPRTVGFQADGKTISWSQKTYSKEYATFQLPCSKCIECRLEYARQWAVRCVHESKMHEKNSFITLTYSDEHLKSDRLQYIDFQLFIKKLRKQIYEKTKKQDLDPEKTKISIFVTGEYGDKKKRPHWHALIFNWSPDDLKPKYTNHNGDQVYTSEQLNTLWGKGFTEVGSVSFESAGYVARYAAKKLTHGQDQAHDYHPISKKSCKQAIGKKFIEKFWPDIFNYGHVILDDGQKCTIPRYYEKWLQKHQPTAWANYVTQLKANRAAKASIKNSLDKEKENIINQKRDYRKGFQTNLSQSRKKIIEQKFKRLQGYLKGDI